MAAPDPEGFGLLSKVLAAATAVGVPILGAYKWLDTRLDKKADKHAVNNQFQAVTNELSVQRGHIAKVFDQIRENEQRAQDRHERLMEKIK